MRTFKQDQFAAATNRVNIMRGVVTSLTLRGLLLLCLTCTACNHAVRNVQPSLKLPMRDVVGAIQYAIDKVSSDTKLWAASREEFQHLTVTCHNRTKMADAACAAFDSAAANRCSERCRSGQCTPFESKSCEALSSGRSLNIECWKPLQSRPAWCTQFASAESGDQCGLANPGAKLQVLCKAAARCMPLREQATEICATAVKAKVPSIVSATLELEILESEKVEGGFTVIIFSAGASRLISQNQTQKIVLVPRTKLDPEKYVLGEIGKDESGLSAAAIRYGEALVSPLREAISAVGNERLEPSNDGSPPTRRQNPMQLKEATLTLQLEAGKDKQLGFAKEKDNPVLKANIGSTASSKRANTVQIVFAQPAEKASQ
jgi:hypothetical protein